MITISVRIASPLSSEGKLVEYAIIPEKNMKPNNLKQQNILKEVRESQKQTTLKNISVGFLWVRKGQKLLPWLLGM